MQDLLPNLWELAQNDNVRLLFKSLRTFQMEAAEHETKHDWGALRAASALGASFLS